MYTLINHIHILKSNKSDILNLSANVDFIFIRKNNFFLFKIEEQ